MVLRDNRKMGDMCENVYSEKDVKDFIGKVKDEIISNDIYTADEIFRIINEEAGF